jgi:hypothetical protein
VSVEDLGHATEQFGAAFVDGNIRGVRQVKLNVGKALELPPYLTPPQRYNRPTVAEKGAQRRRRNVEVEIPNEDGLAVWGLV